MNYRYASKTIIFDLAGHERKLLLSVLFYCNWNENSLKLNVFTAYLFKK